MATVFELEADVSRLRNEFHGAVERGCQLEAERDALKQRVDDQAVAMTTGLEWLEGCESLGHESIKKVSDVLAKALRGSP